MTAAQRFGDFPGRRLLKVEIDYITGARTPPLHTTHPWRCSPDPTDPRVCQPREPLCTVAHSRSEIATPTAVGLCERRKGRLYDNAMGRRTHSATDFGGDSRPGYDETDSHRLPWIGVRLRLMRISQALWRLGVPLPTGSRVLILVVKGRCLLPPAPANCIRVAAGFPSEESKQRQFGPHAV